MFLKVETNDVLKGINWNIPCIENFVRCKESLANAMNFLVETNRHSSHSTYKLNIVTLWIVDDETHPSTRNGYELTLSHHCHQEDEELVLSCDSVSDFFDVLYCSSIYVDVPNAIDYLMQDLETCLSTIFFKRLEVVENA